MNIKQVNVVFEFNIDPNIMLTLGTNIMEMQKKLNYKIQQINAQKAPPDAPRIIVMSENFIVNICLNRYEYVIKIPGHISNNINNCIDYIRNNITMVDKYLEVNERGYLWTGVVFQSEFPSKNKEANFLQLLTPLFDRLININRGNKELSSFQLNLGFKEEDLFCNYIIGGYEVINLQLELKPGKNFVNLDNNENKKIEQGISIIVDINNKPKSEHQNAIIDMKYILEKIKNKLTELPDTLNVRGVIDE